MKTAAVIAEYNPFHNGHAYQLREIRRQTGADFILVMMSGDFVQRGAPACIDKYTRCRMALASGADMVCELPVYGALGSAEIFAESAVSLLNHLGCIDFLCFGAETVDSELFDAIVPILAEEPEDYRKLLQATLKSGMNFPAARSHALCSLIKDERCRDILGQPNNILAIEYMKALYKTGSTIVPVPIRRVGAGYHSTDTTAGFSSATAIRHQLADDFSVLAKNQASLNTANIPNGIDNLNMNHLDIPDTSRFLMQSYLKEYPILTSNDFSDILAMRLLDTQMSLTEFVDINSDLANRINSFKYQFVSTEQFTDLLSARNLTATRIARCLFHMILGHKRNCLDTWRKQQYNGYLRVLGFRKQSGRIWKEIAPEFKEQLITRTAKARDHLSGIGLDIYEADLYASRLYRQMIRNRSHKQLPDIASEPVIILP